MWLRALFLRRQVEAEMEREMRSHLDLETEANVRAGMPPDVARRHALLAFRGLDRAKEDYRDALETRMLDDSWRDLRYAARLARRSPGFTLTVVTLLALAVGASSAIFSVAYAVLVRPLPYPDPARLVFITEAGAGVAWPDFLDWRSRATVFDGLAASLSDPVFMKSDDGPLRLGARSVTANFFAVLGARPARGRLFTDADARLDAAPVAVVTYAFWRDKLGASPVAIGKTIALTKETYTVIGVLPPDFRYFTPADVFLLLEPQIALDDFHGMQSRGNHAALYAVGRLAKGATTAAAQAQMHAIAAALSRDYPTTNKGDDIPVLPLMDRVVGSAAPTLIVLAGAVTLLLLIGCINFASLLLNRAASRAHEFSVRAAIGGSRARLVRQLLIEQALLVAAGGLLGALVGAGMLAGIVHLAPADLPRLDEIHLDMRMLALTALAGSACAFACGIWPALQASGVRRRVLALRSGQHARASTSRMRRALMTAEIAVATVLLFGAGLMVRTMMHLSEVDPGFDPHDLQTVSFTLTGPAWSGPEGDAKKDVFFDGVAERLRAIPGVESAALTYTLPLQCCNWWSQFSILGRPAPAPGDFGPNAGMSPVTAGYFQTLEVPLLEGRYFDASDRPTSVPVAIVTKSVAQKYWPGQDPIGQQIRGGAPGNQYGPWRTVVGVVGDTKQLGLDQGSPQFIFMPLVQEPRSQLFAIVRTRSALSPATLAVAVRGADKSVSIFNDRTLDQVLSETTSRRRVAMLVLSVFGCVAVILAAIGLHGVIAQSISDRRHEIGIRMSLGATQGNVVGMFVRGGLVAAGAGLGAGMIAAVVVSRSLASMVFGLETTDPLTIAATVVLLAIIALFACYAPARAAARVDPATALRVD